jgi:hypothetical protein
MSAATSAMYSRKDRILFRVRSSDCSGCCATFRSSNLAARAGSDTDGLFRSLGRAGDTVASRPHLLSLKAERATVVPSLFLSCAELLKQPTVASALSGCPRLTAITRDLVRPMSVARPTSSAVVVSKTLTSDHVHCGLTKNTQFFWRFILVRN